MGNNNPDRKKGGLGAPLSFAGAAFFAAALVCGFAGGSLLAVAALSAASLVLVVLSFIVALIEEGPKNGEKTK